MIRMDGSFTPQHCWVRSRVDKYDPGLLVQRVFSPHSGTTNWRGLVFSVGGYAPTGDWTGRFSWTTGDDIRLLDGRSLPDMEDRGWSVIHVTGMETELAADQITEDSAMRLGTEHALSQVGQPWYVEIRYNGLPVWTAESGKLERFRQTSLPDPVVLDPNEHYTATRADSEA